MEPSPAPWISALRHSHDRLRAGVEPLGLADLEQRSYASEWSIAQVLSHLGSQAEIFGLFLDAGLTGQEPPGREEFMPIWDSWNAKDPQAQASDALRADQATLERFESLDADEQARLHLNMFGMELGATGLARMRVGEHAIHTWDVVVALDPAATVAPDAVDLLVDTPGVMSGPILLSGGIAAAGVQIRASRSRWASVTGGAALTARSIAAARWPTAAVSCGANGSSAGVLRCAQAVSSSAALSASPCWRSGGIRGSAGPWWRSIAAIVEALARRAGLFAAMGRASYRTSRLPESPGSEAVPAGGPTLRLTYRNRPSGRRHSCGNGR